jgi:hypothetical protein
MMFAAVNAGTSSSCSMNRAKAMEVTNERATGLMAKLYLQVGR